MGRAACWIVGLTAIGISLFVLIGGYATKATGSSPRDHIKRVRR